MSTRKPLPSVEELKGQFAYDPETGVLSRVSGAWSRSVAGCVQKCGYVQVKINRGCFFAHRVIWKMVYGTEPEYIDHINRNKADNRLCNLREVTKYGNNWNRPDNVSVPGVYRTRCNTWNASIGVDRKFVNLGNYKTFEEAVAARKEYEAKHGVTAA